MRLKIALVGLLVLLLASGCVYAVNCPEPIPVFPTPYGYAGVQVSMGWYNCQQVWHFCTHTNNLRYTRNLRTGGQLTLAPKLSSALTPRVPGGDIAARPLYMVTNFQNPPIFSTIPGEPLYSALWQVFNITWRPGVTPRAICNAEPASEMNPCGLPGPAEADIVATDAVLDCPILVVGPLTNPPVSDGSRYITPQAAFTDPKSKLVFMPAWEIYCQDPITKRVDVVLTQITDVSDSALATALGANLAPGLLNVPDQDTTDFYVMRGPKPLTQLPLVRDCPLYLGGPGTNSRNNANHDYSPIMRYIILQRNVPPNCLIKTTSFLDFLLGTGGLTILKDDQRINASVIISG